MMLRRLASFAIAALLASRPTSVLAEPVPAPPAVSMTTDQTFSVEAALAAMRRAHPLVRAAASTVRVAEGNATTAGHWANPIVDASYFQALRNSSYDPIGTPAVGVTQFLEFAGTPAARRRSAQSEVRATQADRDGVKRNLEWTVREAYVRLAISYDRQSIYRDAITDLERASGIVRARVGSGVAPRYDSSRIQLAVEQAHADLADAEADALRARGDFDIAVGPGAVELRGAPSLNALDVPPPPSLAASVDGARGRPDLVAARHRTDAAMTDIDVARKLVFPGIGLRLGTGYGQSTGQLDVGAGVIVPLPLIERGQGSIMAAQARAEANSFIAEALTTAADQRVQAAHAEYVKRFAALSRFRTQTATVNEGMRGEAEAGYREAKLSVLELVDAYHSLRDARLRLLELAEGAQVASIALLRAVGAEGPER